MSFLKTNAKEHGTQKKIIPTGFVRYAAMGIIFFALVVGSIFYFHEQSILFAIQTDEISKVRQGKDSIIRDLSGNKADLMFLNDLLELKTMLEGSGFSEIRDEQNRQQLAQAYLRFAQRQGVYDQIRYLDETGNEIIRVNFNAGKSSISSKDELQNKAGRYYFSDTIRLNRGEVYISPFDLNMEHDQIELPFKPMLRFATPTFEPSGKKNGSVCVNYLGEHLIHNFRENAANEYGMAELVNSDGYWISSTLPTREWGFMFEDKKNSTFSSLYPLAWDVISKKREGQVRNSEGLFSFMTLAPFDDKMATDDGPADKTGNVQRYFSSKTYQWIVVSRVSPEMLAMKAGDMKYRYFGIWLALSGLSLVSSYFFAQNAELRKEYNESLHAMATHDALTGLPNRNQFSDRLRQNLAHAKRYGNQLAVLFMDLDGFKQVNDTYGHGIGDLLLIEVAARIKGCIRESDTVARMGGDEFTVILSVIKSEDDLTGMIGRISASMLQPFRFNEVECDVGISIGAATYPQDGTTDEALMNQADARMYEIKSEKKRR